MKALRNPWVVGLMATAAVGVMVGNLFWPAIQRWRATRASMATAATAQAASTSPLGTPQAGAVPAEASAAEAAVSSSHVRPDSTSMDRPLIRRQVLRWLQASTRDPFVAIRMAGRDHPKGPPASDNLQVSAILRQTGSQLAIINQALVSEGDKVAGYVLERIEGDGVWVRGTNGLEQVKMPGPIPEPEPVVPPPATKSAEATPVQALKPTTPS